MKKIAYLLSAGLLMCGALAGLTGCGGDENPTTGGDTDAKVLRVAMECGYAPYNWTQNDDANGAVPIADSTSYANGYDVMMAKYLADQIGYDLEIYKIDWDSLPLAVQSGAVDCVIAGQSITAERLETVDFTTPYYYASIVAVTRDDTAYAGATTVDELAGAVCTSQINTVWYDAVLPQIPDAKIQPATESAPQMLVALNSGAVDLVATDMPTAMAAQMVYPNFQILDMAEGSDFVVDEEEINIGISLAKGNTELLDLLNGALATLTTEDFETMMNDAITVQPLTQE
ncbi:MAG: transporter substrate-binding domain-containing protein [Firmicutes bacterium]|nr:transporter substrate-binding domain-containing protein [Bacillota bacterium]